MAVTEAQDGVVRAVAADGGIPNWQRIVADVEIEEAADGYHFDCVSFTIARTPDNDFEDPQFSLSRAARDAVIELYKTLRAEAGNTIGGFTLEIENSGTYRFDFSYGKPKRLNGVWDAEKEARLDNYLVDYKAKLAAPGGQAAH